MSPTTDLAAFADENPEKLPWKKLNLTVIFPAVILSHGLGSLPSFSGSEYPTESHSFCNPTFLSRSWFDFNRRFMQYRGVMRSVTYEESTGEKSRLPPPPQNNIYLSINILLGINKVLD